MLWHWVREELKNGLEEGLSQCLHERSVCSDSADPTVTVTPDSWTVFQVYLYAGKSCSPSLSSVRMVFSFLSHSSSLPAELSKWHRDFQELYMWNSEMEDDIKVFVYTSKLNRIWTSHQEIVCDYPCWLLVICPHTVSDHINNLCFGQWQNSGWQHR